jgi:hypothetical protein
LEKRVRHKGKEKPGTTLLAVKSKTQGMYGPKRKAIKAKSVNSLRSVLEGHKL